VRRHHVRPLAASALAVLVLAIPAAAKTIAGTNGPDVLRGTAQGDKLYGKGGNDRLFGLDGNDLLVGGPGRDLLEGAAGNDRILARDDERDMVRCGSGKDQVVVDRRDQVAANCESVDRPAAPTQTFVVAVAGDIASEASGDEETAALLDRIAPAVVLTTGDNAYPDGALSEFQAYYEPTWGRHRARTRPSPGNHDYHTQGASGYFAYFGARAPGPYYSFDLGSWHLISLNSEISMDEGSAQYRWLQSDLAASDARCTLAYWHKPRFVAGRYDDFTFTTPIWRLLYAAKAEVVLNGHDHNYQRYGPSSPDGAPAPVRGLREFVVGTGGRSLYGLSHDPRREAGQARVIGVLQLTLRASAYDWSFVPVSGGYSDAGSGACR
jgi:Calcineurin-like phosphoesterase/RTX calcium-binding nonapeptide repeat (4 copies)